MSSKNTYSKKEKDALQRLRTAIEQSGNDLLVNNRKERTDEHLLMYLRCRNYHVPSALEKIERTMAARVVRYPEVFSGFYPSALYRAFETKGGGVLKHRDSEGRQVLFLRASDWDPDELDVEDMLRCVMMLGYEMLQNKETQFNGIVLIVDVAGFGFKHAKQANPVLIQKYANIILSASPLKIKAAHILNAPRLFNMTLSLIKLFLPQKLRKRIYVHGDSMESLHKWVSPEILPDYFGGNLVEKEALDYKIVDDLYTQEKEDYYKGLIETSQSLLV